MKPQGTKDDELNVPGEPGQQREEFLNMLKKGAAFTEDLLKENERLRFKIAELESRVNNQADQSPLVLELMERVKRLESEKEDLHKHFEQVTAENQDFATRYVEVEEENNNLANLYVASYQLHSTMDFDEVQQIITEIVINLIGAQVFMVALVDPKTDVVRPVSVEGFDAAAMPEIKVGEGRIGQVVSSGESYIVTEIAAVKDDAPFDIQAPLVAVPLKIKETVLGALCIYRFLQQKKKFANVDYELFTLLAGHAATAIFSSKLYTESKRKLQTLQGLLQLMTS
jgi:transcriptional regulator with GAF, ATPase, and Fis domain